MNKEKQEKLLCEIIKADEKDGLYQTDRDMWIKTGDSLPEVGERVLAYYTEDKWFEIAYIDYRGDWRRDDGDCPYFKITHWRHLPYPPKDEPKTDDNRLKEKPLNYIEVDNKDKEQDGGWVTISVNGSIENMFSIRAFISTFGKTPSFSESDVIEIHKRIYGIGEVVYINDKKS